MTELCSSILRIISHEVVMRSTPTLAKGLASSLVRSQFSGLIRISKDYEKPLFMVARQRIVEKSVEPSPEATSHFEKMLEKQSFMFREMRCLESNSEDWLIYSDSASIALRNIDHLFPVCGSKTASPERADLYWTELSQREGNLASNGFWAVRGRHLPLVLEMWRTIWEKEHRKSGANEIWTKVLECLPLRISPFERGEVYAPRIGAVDWEAVSNAAFVTVPDWPEKEQWKFLQALYFGTYFGDETGLMLNILDP